PDLFAPNGGSPTVSVFLGDGHGNFSQAAGSPFSTGGHPFSAAVGDLNGDGAPDIVTGNNATNDVPVLLRDGAGGFAAATGSPFAAGTNPDGVAIGDVNGDQKPDLAVSDFTGGVTLLLGDGSGGFTPAASSPLTAGTAPEGLAFADLNGDGHP